MNEYVYATQRTPLCTGRVFRNPRFFQACEPDATKVYLIGDWPKVKAAYRAAGIVVVETESPSAIPIIPPALAQSIAKSQGASEEIEICDNISEFPPSPTGSLAAMEVPVVEPPEQETEPAEVVPEFTLEAHAEVTEEHVVTSDQRPVSRSSRRRGRITETGEV
jgi:hypothetical protein